jgi:hypothetical protein
MIDGLELYGTLNCKRGMILTILKTLDDVLEEKRKEKEQAVVEPEAAAAKRKQQEDLQLDLQVNFVLCTLYKVNLIIKR